MDSAQQMATQVVLDALALRGPGNGSSFRMVTITPEQWPAERLRLARKFERMIPATATADAVASIAQEIAPHLQREIGRGDFVSSDSGAAYFRS
jgi:hypothetical protein